MVRPNWTETTKRMVVVIGVVLGCVLLYLGRSTLISLLLASVVAYALFPLVGFLHRRLRFPHTLATVVVYILVLAILESTYPYCADIDSVPCSSKAEFLGSMAIRTVSFAVLCMLSASVLAPLQVASGMASKLGAGRKR